MSEQQVMTSEMEEEEEEAAAAADNAISTTNTDKEATECAAASRKERRKMAKKEKRKKKRKEIAEMVRREEEARINDPEERLRLEAEEEQEKLRVEKERREFEERERRIQEEWARRIAQEEREEEERRRAKEEEEQLKQNQVGCESELDEDGWEYVEDGPPEIIWQGNEIIVKKKKIRVKKKDTDHHIAKEDPNRPTSNPLPPQSEAFADYKNGSMLSAQQLLENVAQETPNFGTEHDKAHCPFHHKTGACRFGSHCSRIHFYPDKSCTMLIKNMYSGPGIAWEQDEGLEKGTTYIILPVTDTDEEVDRAYEEFYEDVHTEFLKFGEIVNFKVCRNGSPHLRGNVYVHYKSMDSAVLAYQTVNGRYFAGKQVQCEFVGVTRWRVAICGEFMKSKFRTCSRGTTCNFIHCFRNPGGDYEWADWDKPPPKYWLEKMAALFGYPGESGYDYDKHIVQGSPKSFRRSSRILDDADRYHFRRSRSRSKDAQYSRSSKDYSDYDIKSSAHRLRHKTPDRKRREVLEDKRCGDASSYQVKRHCKEDTSVSSDSDRNLLDREADKSSSYDGSRNQACRSLKLESRDNRSNRRSMHELDPDENMSDRNSTHSRRRRRNVVESYELVDGSHGAGGRGDCSDEDRVKSANQQSKVSSPDDHWDGRGSTYENDITDDWSYEERDSPYIYTDQSPRSDDEIDHKKSKRRHAHKLKHTSTGDHLGRGNGERRKSTSSGRNHRSGSKSRSYSRKDTYEHESRESEKQFPDHFKKSKRKRDTDYDTKGSHASECRFDAATDTRDRWEPDKGDCSEQTEPTE